MRIESLRGSSETSETAGSRAPDTPPAVKSGPARWLLLLFGLLFMLLGLVGAFLPVLPTTPFLLVAAACFMRSSPKLHARLLSNRVFGPYLMQWQRDHTVPREAKRKAYGLVILSFSLSAALTGSTQLRVVLVLVGAGLIVLLACLPTTARDAPA